MADRTNPSQPRGRHKAGRGQKNDIEVRPKGGDSQTERERNAGKEGGARRGTRDRNGSDHEKG